MWKSLLGREWSLWEAPPIKRFFSLAYTLTWTQSWHPEWSGSSRGLGHIQEGVRKWLVLGHYRRGKLTMPSTLMTAKYTQPNTHVRWYWQNEWQQTWNPVYHQLQSNHYYIVHWLSVKLIKCTKYSPASFKVKTTLFPSTNSSVLCSTVSPLRSSAVYAC